MYTGEVSRPDAFPTIKEPTKTIIYSTDFENDTAKSWIGAAGRVL